MAQRPDSHDSHGAIAFAEKVLELLDEGRYTATYKYAVLLALLDLCLERTQASGAPPDSLTTRQFAEKIVELYWPHSLPFASRGEAAILRQNTSGQTEVLSAILRFRQRHAEDPSMTIWRSKLSAPAAFERLVRHVEWKLIEMPLPRLQVKGREAHEFIYRIGWDKGINPRNVARHQDGELGVFDNRVLLMPGVGEYLLQLNGLLRPLIQRRWAKMVALLNRLEESRLETFLFGADRMPTAKVRAGVWEIQGRRCFYCEGRLREPTAAVVDHFVPWSRYPDDGLDNFVVADARCNAAKSNSLAAAEHVRNWARRFSAESVEHTQLSDLAMRTRWERNSERSLNVARAIYLRLPPDARLWLRGPEFVAPDSSLGPTLSPE